MADLVTSRIESIAEARSGPHDQSAPKPRTKGAAAAAKNAAPSGVPQIGTPEEEDKHELDEMA